MGFEKLKKKKNKADLDVIISVFHFIIFFSKPQILVCGFLFDKDINNDRVKEKKEIDKECHT